MLDLSTNLYARYGVDVDNISKVTQGILNSSQNTVKDVQVQSIDYSKFNRQTLGVDLYSSKTDVDLQKQIALTQAGLYAKSINVAQLNSAAAQSLYSANNVQRNVELAQSVSTNEIQPDSETKELKSPIKTFKTSDEGNSSPKENPFLMQESNSDNEDGETGEVNIFA